MSNRVKACLSRHLLRLSGAAFVALSSSNSFAQWNYTNFPDPGTGEILRLALVKSSSWKGTLFVRMSPEGTVNVAFGVPATILCSTSCRVLARIDGKETALRDARYPGNMRNMLYFSPDSLSFARIRAAEKVEVEVETKEYGWRVLTFDTRDFDMNRLNIGR